MADRSHLVIDGVGAKHGGAATVLLGVVEAALEHPDIGRTSVFASPAAVRQFRFPTDPRLDVIEMPRLENNRFRRLLWLEHGLARSIRRLGAGRALCLGGGGIVSLPGVVSATFVQRSQPLSTERVSGLGPTDRLRRRTFRLTIARSARACSWVFVQTATVRKRLVDDLGIEPGRVRVFEPTISPFPVGAPHPAIAPVRLAPPGARLLYVGSDAPHKNLGTLRKMLWLVRRTRPQATLFLTLPDSQTVAQGEGLCGLGYLSDRVALGQAYAECDVVVLASVEETVGLPLVEAMQAGKPVVVADLPYAREVCGDAALYFSPKDARDAARQVERLLADDALRRRLGELGRRMSERRNSGQPWRRMLDTLAHSPG